jgi:prevent-host-death family protein
MANVSVRDLRNNVSGVLRRVERGERLRVTVHGRPVAELVPLGKPLALPWSEFIRRLRKADPGLAHDLRELAPDTTDEIPLRY